MLGKLKILTYAPNQKNAMKIRKKLHFSGIKVQFCSQNFISKGISWEWEPNHVFINCWKRIHISCMLPKFLENQIVKLSVEPFLFMNS